MRRYIWVLLFGGCLGDASFLKAAKPVDEDGFQTVFYSQKKSLPQKSTRLEGGRKEYRTQKKKALRARATHQDLRSPPSPQRMCFVHDQSTVTGEDLQSLLLSQGLFAPHRLNKSLSKRGVPAFPWDKYATFLEEHPNDVEAVFLRTLQAYLKKPTPQQKRTLFSKVNQYLHQHHYEPRLMALYAVTLELGLGVEKAPDRAKKFAQQALEKRELWLAPLFSLEEPAEKSVAEVPAKDEKNSEDAEGEGSPALTKNTEQENIWGDFSWLTSQQSQRPFPEWNLSSGFEPESDSDSDSDSDSWSGSNSKSEYAYESVPGSCHDPEGFWDSFHEEAPDHFASIVGLF